MKVRFKVVRTETWYPEYEVPDGLTDEDVLEYIATENPASVYDEMINKATLDMDMDVEVVR
jgi:hypothetical protein|tara:strand:- start:942 stop:1124 length:183 start_codon:yes stop_codon:yes gene_type:complete